MAWTEINEIAEEVSSVENSEKQCECLCEIKDLLCKILCAIENTKHEPDVIAYNERKPMNV